VLDSVRGTPGIEAAAIVSGPPLSGDCPYCPGAEHLTAPEIAEIRGVNTAGVLGTLIERHLIRIMGRKPVVGRPFMYATTREFLERFGLNDLNDLPKVEVAARILDAVVPRR